MSFIEDIYNSDNWLSVRFRDDVLAKMKQYNVSAKDLCRHACIDPSNFSKYMRLRVSPTLKICQRILDSLEEIHTIDLILFQN